MVPYSKRMGTNHIIIIITAIAKRKFNFAITALFIIDRKCKLIYKFFSYVCFYYYRIITEQKIYK